MEPSDFRAMQKYMVPPRAAYLMATRDAYRLYYTPKAAVYFDDGNELPAVCQPENLPTVGDEVRPPRHLPTPPKGMTFVVEEISHESRFIVIGLGTPVESTRSPKREL